MSLIEPQLVEPRTQPFGRLLKQWRMSRRLSQLALAEKACVSARHLCHLETGRAQPSRVMVQQLGDALGLPLAEQNALHISAGFVPPFQHGDLGARGLERVRQALDFMLQQHNPFPALVVDGRWDICLRNDTTERLFAPFRARYDMSPQIRRNAQHVVFHPKGLRPFIRNWREFAGHMLRLLEAEAVQGSRHAAALCHELRAYPQADDVWQHVQEFSGHQPLVTLQLELDGRSIELFSAFTRFAMPRDVALQELKIETLYAADAATETYLRQLSRQT